MMRPATRRLPVIVAMLMTIVNAAAAQAPARPPRDMIREARPSGAGSISGRVIAVDTGIPLRNAIVSLTGGNARPREVVTNDQGRFQVRDVEAGLWQLSVSRSGYITRKHGQTRPFGRITPIAVSANSTVSVEIPLTRASAITGRVFDEYGEPVTAARVTVLRPRMARHRRYLEPVGNGDLTDDTGAFRLHSLPAGEYFVTASMRVAPPDSGVQTTYAATYFPGTADFAAAQKVRVGPGAEAVIEFPLRPIRTARVSGMVVASNGQAANAFLSLASEAGELGTPIGAGGVTREDGTFVMADVPPGTYTLVAEVRSDPATVAEIGHVTVNVTVGDVPGIVITTATPGTLRGTIAADAGVTRPVPDGVEIAARPRRSGMDGTFTSSSAGSFDMPTPPGPFTLEVEPPEGWNVKSITLGGLDASDLAIDIAGEKNVPVTVVLTDRVTDLSGTVTGATAAQVVVFPADSASWTPRRVRSTETDGRGRYRILGLPPGERYLAIAVEELEEGQDTDPDFLLGVQKDAVAFDLGAAEKRVLDVKVLRP